MKHLAPLLLPLALAGRGGFDHGLEMEPLAVPEAHHGEKMRLSRFLVAVPGIEETATRLLNKCVSGQDVASDLPLELAVVELRIDAVYFAGVRVGDARAGVPSPDAEEALGQALQQAADSSRWLSKRGCKPWTGERPWLLLAADERVAMQGVNGLMEQAHAAGFRDIAVLVDDGSPAPELPPEEPPKNARELMLVERPESWTALAGEDERRSGSLEDVQVWLRTGELSAERVTVVMDPASELSELIRVQDALVGAGVLFVLPGQVDGAGASTLPQSRELERGEVRWVIDAEGVVPVHLVRLPEGGIRVPEPRVGPELSFQDLRVVGPLNALQIQALLDRGTQPVRLCYDTALEADPQLAGGVDLEFTIEKDGTVSGLHNESSLGSRELMGCLRREVQDLDFRSAEAVTLVTVRVEFRP